MRQIYFWFFFATCCLNHHHNDPTTEYDYEKVRHQYIPPKRHAAPINPQLPQCWLFSDGTLALICDFACGQRKQNVPHWLPSWKKKFPRLLTIFEQFVVFRFVFCAKIKRAPCFEIIFCFYMYTLRVWQATCNISPIFPFCSKLVWRMSRRSGSSPSFYNVAFMSVLKNCRPIFSCWRTFACHGEIVRN